MTSEHIYPLWTRETVLPDVQGNSGYIVVTSRAAETALARESARLMRKAGT